MRAFTLHRRAQRSSGSRRCSDKLEAEQGFAVAVCAGPAIRYIPNNGLRVAINHAASASRPRGLVCCDAHDVNVTYPGSGGNGVTGLVVGGELGKGRLHSRGGVYRVRAGVASRRPTDEEVGDASLGGVRRRRP
jgi:hypothetical protein